jgi:hypothetical protein
VVSSVSRWARSLATARAPEGQASADPRSVSRDTVRLVAFSDGVFAITITLLVLEIRPPTDDENLLHDLVALWPSYLAYAVTFLFIGQVWANHHVIFDHIRAADRIVLLLNTVLLMVVAFLPFATSVLAEALRSGHGERLDVATDESTQRVLRHQIVAPAAQTADERAHTDWQDVVTAQVALDPPELAGRRDSLRSRGDGGRVERAGGGADEQGDGDVRS